MPTLDRVQNAPGIGRAPPGSRLRRASVAIAGAAIVARGSVLRRRQAELLRRLRERERELATANLRLSEESRRDPLTGLFNRLRLGEDFVALAAGMDRHGRGYCFVLFDLDRFKGYNDGMGHQAGDRALRRVAGLLKVRAGDTAYRYGGEELLLVLRDQDASAALRVAERHRASVQGAAMAHPHNPPAGVVTLSGGIAAARPGETPEEVLNRADTALYTAKAQGRNRIAVASGDLLADRIPSGADAPAEEGPGGP